MTGPRRERVGTALTPLCLPYNPQMTTWLFDS
jgi:hypothetical protein